jgi:hypothetical protein
MLPPAHCSGPLHSLPPITQDIFDKVDKSGEGVCVQASTLGSLEALLAFLDSDDVQIPVSGINIGPVHKKDVLRANVMAEKGVKKVRGEGGGMGFKQGGLAAARPGTGSGGCAGWARQHGSLQGSRASASAFQPCQRTHPPPTPTLPSTP